MGLATDRSTGRNCACFSASAVRQLTLPLRKWRPERCDDDKTQVIQGLIIYRLNSAYHAFYATPEKEK